MNKILLLILCAMAFAQAEKPKAAVYIKGNPEGRDALRMAVNTFLIKSQKYQMIAVDAIDVVAEEQNRQRSGSVSNEDIAALGRDAGAAYVCVVERSESDGVSYVSTSMVSVQSKIAELSEMSELPRGERIISLIERQINKMLGISTPEPEPEYATKYMSPVENTYSEDSYTEPQDEDYNASAIDNRQDIELSKRTIRLGLRWRGGFITYGAGVAGSELFGKSYAKYEEMKKSVFNIEDFYNAWYLNPGLTLNIRITDMISLATELSYNCIYGLDIWYGVSKDEKDEYFANVSMSYKTIEIPVLLKLLLGNERGSINAETGFQWGFPVSSKATVKSGSKFPNSPFEYEYSDFRVKTDYGLVFGLGMRMLDFSIGIRYTYPLTKLDKYGNIDAPSVINLTFAYDFF